MGTGPGLVQGKGLSMYTIRKFARDLAVAVAGTLLLYVGTEPLPVEVPLSVGPFIPPVALALYREVRKHSAFLNSVDEQGV